MPSLNAARNEAERRAYLIDRPVFVVRTQDGQYEVCEAMPQGAEVIDTVLPPHAMPRFNKRNFALWTLRRMHYIQKAYRFTSSTGYSQVDRDHLTMETKTAYGRWVAYLDLWNNLNLGRALTEDDWVNLNAADINASAALGNLTSRHSVRNNPNSSTVRLG